MSFDEILDLTADVFSFYIIDRGRVCSAINARSYDMHGMRVGGKIRLQLRTYACMRTDVRASCSWMVDMIARLVFFVAVLTTIKIFEFFFFFFLILRRMGKNKA